MIINIYGLGVGISTTKKFPCGHALPEVNFLMVEIPTLKPYIYSLFSYLFIKQDQMIMTCNSAVASQMLSRFL
jgi:hypothetical protein